MIHEGKPLSDIVQSDMRLFVVADFVRPVFQDLQPFPQDFDQGTVDLLDRFRQMKLIPEEQVPDMTERLVELIHENGGCLDTGFVSMPFLLDVLYENGWQLEDRDVFITFSLKGT